MEFNLKVGLEGIAEKIVTEDDTAAKFGSGNVHVFATPMMIGLMENAALNAVDKELGKEHATVGIHVDVKHLGATPVGMKVKGIAKLTKIDGKKLYFDVEAYDEEKLIGKGTHTRYIINVEEFLGKINRK
ncbi:Thioesterase superfamily [Caloranaerobacter azorensis DSM 13643]|uniref:Thioesterase superfamily n=1 Tax=Caloranaerobacter azorensis DSM 13643 TaxID=1121264 RepID=A0A1M5SVI6_9FIRM|nr:thioesterase family protein [Caloranaerobacter azorensis]SHH42552.1 Thioesterase superfamily [Caloranaerobacter azorensis DSM 13643]